MVRSIAYLFTTCFICVCFMYVVHSAQRPSTRQLIQGTWQGIYDTTEVTLTMKGGWGKALFAHPNSRYSFKYSLIGDSIIKMVSGKEKSLHIIKQVTEKNLQLSPRLKYQESEEIIDLINFKRLKP